MGNITHTVTENGDPVSIGAQGGTLSSATESDGVLKAEAVGFAELDPEGHLTRVNAAMCVLTGRSESDLLGLSLSDVIDPADSSVFTTNWSHEAEAFEQRLRLRRTSGATVWVDLRVKKTTRGASGNPISSVAQMTDVTRQIDLEHERNLALKALAVLRTATDQHAAAEALLEAIQSETGIEALGIRIARESDFRYLAQRGFSPTFILAEDSLCAHDQTGALLRNADGTPRLACTCGLVIEGRTDASDPLYSPRGSAWTNDASSFPHIPPSLATRLNPRDVCLQEGYRSIALIPIRTLGAVVGLLQLNDRRPGLFSPSKIAFFEDLAASFGILFERLASEDCVRTNAAHLRLAFEAAKAGSWQWDPRTGENLWSDSLWALYGLDPHRDRACYETWLQVIHPDDRVAAERTVQDAVQHGSELNAEWRICMPSGETRWLMSRGRPIRDAQGRFERYAGIVMDIDERKRAEETLMETEQRYDQVSENNRTIAWEVDATGLYTYVNRAIELVLGFRPEDIVGKKHFYDLHPAEGREAFRKEAFEVFARKEKFVGYNNRCETQDGHVLWMRTSGIPTIDGEGRLRGYRGIDIDITEAMLFEESQSFLLTCGMPSTGKDFFESLASHLAQRTGADSVCIGRIGDGGKNIFTLARWSSGALRDNICYPLENSPCGEVLELTYKAYDRDLRAIFRPCDLAPLPDAESYAGVALHDSTGLNIGLIAVMARQPFGNLQGIERLLRFVAPRTAGEIERRRIEDARDKIQRQLSLAQKMESIGRLAGGVAHDFNNMLGVIIGNAELALSDLAPSESTHGDIQEILDAAERSAELTRQLLVFARKQSTEPKAIDLNQSISGMIKMLARLIGEDIELVWDPHVESAPIMIDPAQLDQILANLVINARDAITEAGQLIIETDRIMVDETVCADQPDAAPGDYVRLIITDNGCGMNPETLAHIFEPFFTTKDMGRGTGLGLSTVYGIIRQNKGFIRVYSEVGKGSVFKIHLPCHGENSNDTSGHTESHPVSKGSETVLLVEDEAGLRKTGARNLRALGYLVLTASCAEEAIRTAESHAGRIDLLITDIVMPGTNGLTLSQALIAGRPNLPCLFMSGYTADVITNRTKFPKGARLIEKPFTRRQLALAVREMLDARASG